MTRTKGPVPRANRKARQVLARAEYAIKLALLRSTGASCNTCKYKISKPAQMQGNACELDSDFQGYAMIELNHLCLGYTK